MAKKRRAKARKRAAGRTRRVGRISRAKRFAVSGKRRINLVLKNLIVFLAMSLISFLLSKILKDVLFIKLFSFLSIIFILVALAFFIVLSVFLILRMIKKK